MKRAVTLAAALVAIGIAGFALSGKRGEQPEPTRSASKADETSRPTKTERIDDDHDPDRFDSLDDEMRRLAMELESAAIKWNRARPQHESFPTLSNDWLDYSTARIAEFDTRQIRELARWMDERQYSELTDYRQAVIMIWSSREPDVVRARLLGAAELLGFIGKEVETWRNNTLDELSDNFHFARIGHSMVDPKGAWEEFLQDAANPGMKYFVNASLTLPHIFNYYSARAPEDAWNLALTTTDEDWCGPMLEGFADGAPAGQEWETRGREFLHSLAEREIEPGNWAYRPIAERWLLDDPATALDWYARSAWLDELRRSADPFSNELDPLPPLAGDGELLLKVDLLASMYLFFSPKDRSDAVIAALEHLATRGDSRLAAAGLGKLIDNIGPMDTSLLGLIPRFAGEETRNQLFLQAVEAIPVRDDGPFSPFNLTLEGPNPSLEAVRALASQLDLTPEIQAQAEEAFRKVEAAELKALEEQELRRRNEDDPFAPGR